MSNPLQASASVKSLATLSLVCMLVLCVVWLATEQRVKRQEQQMVEQRLVEVLGEHEYSNDIVEDRFIVRLSDDPHSGTATVYRARSNGKAIAVVYDTKTPEGYGGIIRLLVGVNVQNAITGVRIVTHRETPGLGDAIDLRNSDWIKEFDNLSLELIETDNWRVKKDGGRFDQFTGATITPRAVVNRIHDILLVHRSISIRVFTLPKGVEYRADVQAQKN